jgi:hypothetical protein
LWVSCKEGYAQNDEDREELVLELELELELAHEDRVHKDQSQEELNEDFYHEEINEDWDHDDGGVVFAVDVPPILCTLPSRSSLWNFLTHCISMDRINK